MRRVLLMLLLSLGAFAVLRQLWPSVRRLRGAVAVAALTLLALFGWGAGRLGLEGAAVIWLKLFSATWTVTTLATLVGGGTFLVLRRLVRWAAARRRRGGHAEAEPDPGRRSLLLGVGRMVPVAAVATGAGGVANASGAFVVRREEVRVRGLPAALDGFRIGQLTDVHVGPFVSAEDLARAVAALDEEAVDLQVMTGDLIDDMSRLGQTIEALESCRAAHGLVAVLGNHEHWRGLERIKAAYARSEARTGRLRLLVDQNLRLEHAGAPLRVVGVDYPMSFGEGRAHDMRRSAEAAFAGLPSGETVLCLSHHPDFFPLAAARGAHLTLAGHTHGGQVALFGLPLFGFAFRHMLGRYRREGRHLYVSGGTGHWLPYRVGVPAEVTVLTLRRG